MITGILALGVLSMANVVKVEDFGAVPGVRKDACEAVQKAVRTLKSGDTLKFPNGDFHFYAGMAFERELYLSNTDVVNPRRVAIPLEGLKNVRIQGSGKTRLLFHGRIMPFLVDRCENLTIKGFEVDWERPLMSQFEVVKSESDGLTLKIDPKQYPYAIREGKLVFLVEGEEKQRVWWMEFDPKTRGVAYNTGDRGCMAGNASDAVFTALAPGLIRMAYKINSDRPKVGNQLIARHGTRDHAGTFIQNSKGIRLDDIAFRHTSGLGVLAQRTENLSFNKIIFAATKESGRLFSGHDDGFHISNCKGQVTIENCWFDGLMDDPINVHGTSVRAIEKIDARTWKIRFMHGQSQGFVFGNVGDEVSFLSRETMAPFGRAKITELKPVNIAEWTIKVDRDVPNEFQVGDAIENLTWTPNATIRKNYFGTVRARGLLVSTPGKVVISENLFKSSGSAILIAGDANGWYESGAVTDVLIEKNRFENCLTSTYQFSEAVISIYPEIPATVAPPFHKNIRIVNNTFKSFQIPILWARAVDGLTFTGNSVEATKDYVPWVESKDALTFIDCKNLKVSGNKLDDTYIKSGFKLVRSSSDTDALKWP